MSLDALNRIANDATAKERKADSLRSGRRALKQYHDKPLDVFLKEVASPTGWTSCPDVATAAIRKVLEEAKSELINLAVIRLAAEEGAVRREAARLKRMVDAAIVKTGDDQ